MKKKTVLIISIVFIVLLSAVLLAACNKNKTAGYDNVSRSVDAYYVGESDAFAVSIEKGRRENIFIADGVATDVKPFGELIITPLLANSYDKLSFTATAGSESLSGEITTDKFGEFKSLIDLPFAPSAITVTAGGKSETIDLQNILQDKLSSADIKNIAEHEFADRIAAEKGNGELKREVYIKLMTADRETYYYFISYIGESVDYWALLVDPVSGAVVARK